MSIQSDLYAHISSDAGLTALVSDRVYPVKAPQEPSYPLVSYSMISGQPQNTLDGTGSLNNSLFQFDVYADTYAEALSVADALEAAMAVASFTNSMQSRIDADFETSVEQYRIILDFSIWHL